jgi:hypothetical protein
MHILMVVVLVLLLPVAVDALEVTFINLPDLVVDVTVTAVGAVPLPSGPFEIDDTFVLHGTGAASGRFASGCCSNTREVIDVNFNASGNGVTARGSVFTLEAMDAGINEAALDLITPRYGLSFFPGSSSGRASVGRGSASFFAVSNEALVQVGPESATLIGTASFQGTGVPEPAVGMLLFLGAIGVVLAKRIGGTKATSHVR